MVREFRVLLFTNDDFLVAANPYFSFVNLNANVRLSSTLICTYTKEPSLELSRCLHLIKKFYAVHGIIGGIRGVQDITLNFY